MKHRFLRLVIGFMVLTVGWLGLAFREWPAFASGEGIGLPGYDVSYGALSTEGTQPNRFSFFPSLSSDGRFVAFFTDANNLGHPNPEGDRWMYLHDRGTGNTVRLSFSESGGPLNAPAETGGLSDDGRYAVYHSRASNVVNGQTDNGLNTTDVFLYDRISDTVQLVSHIPGNPTSAADSASTVGRHGISANGNRIAFVSSATNLVAGDTNNAADIFVYDMGSETMTRILTMSGTESNAPSESASISHNGLFVTFTSSATNLVAGDTNGRQDVFVADLQAATVERVSVASDGTQGNDDALLAAISGDGRYVAFSSEASNLVAGDSNGYEDIFVHDRQTNQTHLVSITTGGVQGNDRSFEPTISGDGRLVMFVSNALSLGSPAGSNAGDAFVRDLQANELTLISVTYQGTPHPFGYILDPFISSNGRTFAYVSDDRFMLETDTNGYQEDVFLYAPPTVHFEAGTYTDSEGTGQFPITVTLDAPWTLTTTVAYSTTDGTATAPADYTDLNGTLTFPPGVTVRTFSIPIVNDMTDEPPETILLELAPLSGGLMVGRPMTATATILDDDGPIITMGTEQTTVPEGNVNVVLTVALDATSVETVTVAYETVPGTASPLTDFTPVSGTLVIPAGVLTATFIVPVLEDTQDEPDETFTVELESPLNATLGTPSSVTLLIDDNDGPIVALTPLLVPVAEGVGTSVVSVTLSNASPQTVTVQYATTADTATAGVDYTPVSGTLLFTPGQTTQPITIPILDDSILLEEDEAFFVMLTAPTNGTLGEPATIPVTITDNDDIGVQHTAEIVAPTDPSTPVTVTFATELGTIFLTLTEVISDGVLTATVRGDLLATPPQPYVTLPTYLVLESDGFAFTSAELQMPYRQSEVSQEEVPEASLQLLGGTSEDWRNHTQELDAVANHITGISESFGTFVVAQLPIPECAVTINNGATHTGTRTVNLFSQMDNAAEMLVGNDAGFPGSTWQPYTTNLRWTLTNPEPQISTLLAYMRVRDADGVVLCGGLTLSDDVIYDPLPPNATIVPQRAGGGYTFTLNATDQQNGSGVATMQVSIRSDFLGVPWEPYTSTVTVDAPEGATVHARVRDGVGNRSAVVTVVVPFPTATPTGTVTPTGTAIPPTVTVTPTTPPTRTVLYLPLVLRR